MVMVLGLRLIFFTTEKMFYRIVETAAPFLSSPLEGQQVFLKDGVVFAFNINGFISLPQKLRIYQRTWNTGAPWTQIGEISDFGQSGGLQYVRGSTVWIVDAIGQYEVKAEAVNSSGTILAAAQRHITVIHATPPTVTITSGPPATSTDRVLATFTTSFSVPETQIRRVEFFDNGVLFASDFEAPFGDILKDFNKNPYELYRGSHNITAKAYDRHSLPAPSSPVYSVTVSGGNARPELTISAPTSIINVIQGQSFNVNFTVSDADQPSNIIYVIAEEESAPRLRYGSDDYAPFTTLSVPTTLANGDYWELGLHRVRVFAKDEVRVPNVSLEETDSYPQYIMVNVIQALPDTFPSALMGGLGVQSTAQSSSPAYIGFQVASQIFGGGMASGLNFDNGVVFTTGQSVAWNDGDGETFGNDEAGAHGRTTTQHYSPAENVLIDKLGGRSTTDAAALQFTAHCTHRQLEMEYQFGSEEYDEYISQFNDGFLILVDDVPVSQLPDGSGLLTVNTVNLDSNRHLFFGDDEDIDPFLTPANQPLQVEYDGMTAALKVHAFVTPGQTHKIKFVIGDINDAEYDSALFIKHGSVRTVSPQP